MELRRSLGFWAGLLVMGFLAWAWWDSCRYQSAYAVGDYMMGSSVGGVLVARDEAPRPSGGWRSRGRANYPLYLLQRPFFLRGKGEAGWRRDKGTSPSVYERTRRGMQTEPPWAWAIYIPYWLILAVAGFGWAGLMIWRARRLRRARMVESTMDVVA